MGEAFVASSKNVGRLIDYGETELVIYRLQNIQKYCA